MDLPRFILLKSNANNKFLCFTKEKDNPSSLRFSYQAKAKTVEAADDEPVKIGFHHLKFEVEKAKSVEGLVHIRSCYNNKYLARKSIDNNNIIAGANEADEDQSKWSCTLFKPIVLDDGDSARGDDVDADLLPLSKAYKIRLLHVSESGQRSTFKKLASDGDDKLAVFGDGGTDLEDSTDGVAFTVFDVEASAILPEYVTFMGYNDKYSGKNISVLAFCQSDVGGEGVSNKIVPAPTAVSQNISICDKEGLGYWCSQSLNDLILLVSLDIMHFVPIKIGNHIALKCLEVGRFVSSMDFAGFKDCVATSDTSITDRAMLRVGEPVRVREILDATYDLADSRIYGANSVEKFSDSRSNYTDVEQDGSFQVEYDTEQKMTWTNSTTVNIGVSVSWSAGIPMIGTLGVDISYEHDQTWTSGGENTAGKKITYTQNIKIPPGKKVILKVTAQKALCDVPYMCKARDLMTDGNVREYEMDGLYSGCNEFDFNSDLTSEDL